jgi:hypothetical protein
VADALRELREDLGVIWRECRSPLERVAFFLCLPAWLVGYVAYLMCGKD